jgi:drug/metabolite transporter (DMT)-like permease
LRNGVSIERPIIRGSDSVSMIKADTRFHPVLGLAVGAVVWGLIWYPYRWLAGHGVGGVAATFLTYCVALAIGGSVFARAWRGAARAPWALAGMALAAGWANLAYVLGMLQGEVMRVLLLFYLAPLWTIPLARMVLGERPTATSYAVIALALAGAVVMLWRPEKGLPLPYTGAEWLGLSSGFGFALANVITRRLGEVSIQTKALANWCGAIVITGAALLMQTQTARAGLAAALPQWPMVLFLGVTLFGVNIAVQYGLTHTPATRAIVILLSELVVAAVSAYWLAGEVMDAQESLGGIMIVAASLFSGKIEEAKPQPATRLESQ